ncbi:MAG: molecular chaperone DnaJ [Actinomycetota bacterium]|nr:molecular chaperone DnaJ [Actinomycetota bacterium]
MATTGTRVRDWATVDYYALLGISANADADEVTRAFRALAKQSHPDAVPDEAAAERFRDIAAAYAVLGDRRTRVEYDRVRAETSPRVVPAPVPAPGRSGKAPAKPWSARRAWVALCAGALVTLLGIGAVALTWSLHQHDARLRARFIAVTATRFDANGTSMVSFATRDGRRIRTKEAQQHGDPSGLGPTVTIRYDPANPEHVITGATSAGRDITFSIVALKLLIGGPVFMAFGYRRLRRARAAR